MKKKALSLLLTLALCLSLLPTAAWATEDEGGSSPAAQSGETHTDHPVCGNLGSDCPDPGHSGHTNLTGWIAISDEAGLNAVQENGHYYLTREVEISRTWEPKDGVVLCLNGNTLQANGDFDAIKVGSDVTFTLTDCKDTGKITHTSGNGRGVYNYAGIFKMYGGSITDNVATSSGGGVYNYSIPNPFAGTTTKAYFYMYGGSISKNKAASGGGIYNLGGNVYMYGGSVTGNEAESSGGGVYTVTCGESNSPDFEMSGTASITNNKAVTGSGVYSYSGGYGSGGTFSMSDNAAITSNTATNSGAVYMESGTLYTYNSAKITDNTKDDGTASNVYLEDSVVIYAGSSFSGKVGLTAEKAGTNSIVVVRAASGATLSERDKEKFPSDDDRYEVRYSNGLLVLAVKPQSSEHTDHYLCNGSSCTHLGGHTENAKTNFDPWPSDNSLPTSGAYYLTKDVTLSGTHTVTGKLTICLNGHKILCNAGDTAKNYTATIAVNSGATFNLTDCHTGTKAGQITHVTGKYGNGVYNHGTFNMYGGSITGNNGHGVMDYTSYGASTAIFNMYGGTLTNNNDSYGGGLENDCYSNTNPSIANLYGGSITNNKGGYRGGGIANSGGSIVNMNDGFVIAGNEVTDRGGGVYNCMSTFNMNGGIIGGTSADDANKADNDLGYGGAGGGVANWGGTFNMNGGTIIGNSSKESGGGVSNSPYFNDVKATFIMNGGKITGNEAQYGGGVSSTGNSAGNGKPAISSDFSVGGKASITDNSGKFGGGVYLGDSTMAVSGSANITNNKNGGTNSNVYLIDGKTMTVDNGFNGMIGVTAKNPAEELVVATGTSLNGNVVTKFQSDDVKYGIKLSGNDLVLTGKTDVSGAIDFQDGTLTYTGSGLRYEKATISEGYNGKFTYTYWVPKGGSTGELDANGLPLAVGTYTVIATYEDDDNYGTARAILEVVAGSNNNNSSSSGGGGGRADQLSCERPQQERQRHRDHQPQECYQRQHRDHHREA